MSTPKVQHLRSTLWPYTGRAAPLAVMGYLKSHLSSEDTPQARRPGIPGKRSKQEVLDLIEDYRQGLVPLIVPPTLLKHHLNRHPVPDWVHQQVYLNPYPKELMLRNHV
jgi:uncharacterized protein YbgA (DUF1722 family)